MVCLFRQKDVEKNKDYKKSVLSFFAALVILAAAVGAAAFAYDFSRIWFDSEGNRYFYRTDIPYYDKAGNTYRYDFEKNGYDYLYINGTQERVVADLCYLDKDGVLYYDETMDIVAADNTSCVDKNGNVYYPVQFSKFRKDGTISYDYSLFSYDRAGNAYTYDNVPYFDKNGDKYAYSFDSETLKGTYTNLTTSETYDNEYCFVDENGYFVYDSEGEFVKQTDSPYSYQYKDKDGNIYYWASGVSWDENTNMHDAYDKIIHK